MKATGIVRRMDELGRIVIPKEIRRTMHLREGDPLEIFTERDGEVIFKKYSPMGDMVDYAGKVCETLGRHCKQVAAVADRDGIIAQYGSGRKDLMEKNSSHALQHLMEQRVHYLYEPGKERLPAVEGEDKFFVEAASPVLCQGDLLGCVMLLGEEGKIPNEQSRGNVQMMADLLGRQMEN